MPDLVVDGADKLCVRLLIELRDHVRTAGPGAVVHLIATDPAAPVDLPAWCHLTGHTYLGPVPGTERPTYALRVSGEALATQEAKPWHVA
ncbi:sulfurtransferase TusA family protein [Nonomuraea phyllanthi]|uniref:Sulfurtransferase TusA family protein n=1 Tax=Nonomuraea phyllanthi TaxID=2219224 RepID=A0A5C4W288_9ACTN|nr:sulfurtransferase TusA family protein [Nonomuraea phyllanthi]KAB8191471.1 sulfurtransferase TusA family protein [Nonomuraea phyllanthi]QFY13202.1 sulfurtransferase TusA family protein [Nonomuraea phyllanthi]